MSNSNKGNALPPPDLNRRRFIKSATVAGMAAAAGALRPRLLAATAADTEILLRPQQATIKISPLIYGHFIEHLGGVV
jgi:alpha-N-arabinofuranosidase